MGFTKDFWNSVFEGAFGEGGLPGGGWRDGNGGGVFAGEPVVGLAEEVVSHFAPVDEVEGFGVGPEAEDFGDVYLAGSVGVVGEAFEPVFAPVAADDVVDFGFEACDDGRDEFGNVVVEFEGFRMFVKVAGTGGADAEGVDFGAGEAVEVVEDHRREGGAEGGGVLGWGGGVSGFVVGAGGG